MRCFPGHIGQPGHCGLGTCLARDRQFAHPAQLKQGGSQPVLPGFLILFNETRCFECRKMPVCRRLVTLGKAAHLRQPDLWPGGREMREQFEGFGCRRHLSGDFPWE